MSDNQYLFATATSVDELYVLVKWPFVQDLMEHDWFQSECLLYNASEQQEDLTSAYFVPLRRIYEVKESGQ